MAGRPSVLDDADDDTVRTVVKLLVEDAKAPKNVSADYRAALEVFQKELRDYGLLRGVIDATTIVERFTCVSCLEDKAAEDGFQTTCQHFYCNDCLSDLFRNALNDRRFYPPRCCGTHVNFDEARAFLDKSLAQTFADKKPELDDPSPVYCASKTCSAYIKAGHRRDDAAVCPRCRTRTCMECKEKAHAGECPKNEGLQQVLALAEREVWRRCYACGRMVELVIGCNHITCVCKAEFCYNCGAKWKTCTCVIFEERRLYERATEIAQREGRERQAVVHDLRNHAECTNHGWGREWGRFICDGCGDRLRKYIYRCNNCRLQHCARCRYNL